MRQRSEEPQNNAPEHDDEPRVSALEGRTSERATNFVNRGWRWALRLGGLVAVVALLGVVGAELAPLAPHVTLPALLSRPTPTPDVRALDLNINQANCSANGVGYWSPDGQRIAVLSCAPNTTEPDLYIYNAQTGAQVGAYLMTKPIQTTLATINESQLSDALIFDSLSWSPNQRMLVILWHAFDFSNSPNPALATRWDVLASLSLAGAHAGQVSVAIQGETTAPTAIISLGSGPVGYTEAQYWDVLNNGLATLNLHNAQTYAWDIATDQVVATAPYPGAPDSAGITPIPAGGRTFSVWMSGELAIVDASSCAGSTVTSGAPTPDLTLLTLDVTQWSPDSRYLLTFTVQARMANPPQLNQAPLVTPACLTAAQVDALPVVAAHDQGMRAALGLLGGHDNIDQVALQWSPDGRRLLAIPSTDGSSPTTAIIYNAATGAVATRLSAGASDIPGAEGSDASGSITGGIWSPNGQRLLLGVITRQSFNIFIYSGRALG